MLVTKAITVIGKGNQLPQPTHCGSLLIWNLSEIVKKSMSVAHSLINAGLKGRVCVCAQNNC